MASPRRLLALASPIVLLALAAGAGVRYAEARADLARARDLLLAGEAERASVLFARTRGVPGLRVQAAAGQDLVQAFRGQDPGGTLPGETRAAFPSQHLLSLLAARKPDGAGLRALATLLARGGD
ncbi:MAG TPA: hypothetical protein VMV21_10820, partial [Vicinamibacteria bacterium]|nr:hypothetical protein [Vicinamibacteria bacterium]